MPWGQSPLCQEGSRSALRLNVACGSIATVSNCPLYVRSSPDSDQIAEVPIAKLERAPAIPETAVSTEAKGRGQKQRLPDIAIQSTYGPPSEPWWPKPSQAPQLQGISQAPSPMHLLESGESLSALGSPATLTAGRHANESLESLGAYRRSQLATMYDRRSRAAFQLAAARRAAFLFAALERFGAAAISKRKRRSVRSRFSAGPFGCNASSPHT